MRDSGVEWIGEIPEGWSTCRMGPNFYMKGRIGWQGLKSDDFIDEGPCLITGTDFDNGTVDWSRCYHISQERFDEDPAIHVQEDDVLFTKDGTVGKLAYVDRNPGQASLNSHLLLIRGFDKARTSQRFLFWVLQSDVFTRFKLLVQHGSVMDSISQTDMRHFIYPLPDIEEQERIAHQLDGEVAEVEAASSTASHQIDVLRRYRESLIHEAVTKGLDPSAPMKPSGVEWIGDINAAWLMSKVKYQADVTLGKMLDAGKIEMAAEEAPYLRAGNIVNGCISGDIKMMPFSLEEKPKFLLRQGDALVVEGGNVGETAIYESADSEMYFQKSLNRVRMFNGRNRFFAYWMSFLKSTGFLPQLCNRSTILHYTREKLLATPMVCPPDAEQDAIVSHLDEHCARIDSIIDLKQRQLDILKRRRQSLIYEYVTGKRRVK